MKPCAQKCTYQAPPRKEYVPRYELDELFDVEDIVVKLQIAQDRIIEAFVHASEWHRGKLRHTDNYIPHVGNMQRDLVEHIFDHVICSRRHSIVTCSELPEWLGDRSSILKEVADDATRRLIAIRLHEMCRSHTIWYNGYNGGIWETTQSVIDQYHAETSYARAIRKIDERLRRESLHGGGRLVVVH